MTKQNFAENHIKSDEYCTNLHLGLSCCPDTHTCCDAQSASVFTSNNITYVEVTVIQSLPEEEIVPKDSISTTNSLEGM